MPTVPKMHPVRKSINRPLTIWRAERRLFFGAVVMGAATFNLFSTLLGGIVMFGCLYALARWATVTDPQILRILLNASRFKPAYEGAEYERYFIHRINHANDHARSQN